VNKSPNSELARLRKEAKKVTRLKNSGITGTIIMLITKYVKSVSVILTVRVMLPKSFCLSESCDDVFLH
jgi:hypothetical protein